MSGYGRIPTVVLACVGEGAHTDHENISVAHMPKTALAYALGAVAFCHS